MGLRVVYLFTSISSAAPEEKIDFELKPSQNGYILNFHLEGFYYMWKKLIEHKVVDEVLMVVESAKGPGIHEFAPGFTGVCVPRMEFIYPFIRKGDVIFARGGFKSWYSFLEQWAKKHWILFYRAATNRGGWPFWDVVLDDLIDQPAGRHIPFTKPTNEDVFNRKPAIVTYDLMLGSSHIHDKKAQWKAVKVVKAYTKKYGPLKCILPGANRGGAKTTEMWPEVKGLKIDVPGCLTRDQLSIIYNKTKLLMHLGAAGQNDRGPLESLHCGTPVLLANPKYHAPFLKHVAFLTDKANDFEAIADDLHDVFLPLAEQNREMIYKDFMAHSAFETTTLPEMRKLFSIIETIGRKPDREEFTKRWTSTAT